MQSTGPIARRKAVVTAIMLTTVTVMCSLRPAPLRAQANAAANQSALDSFMAAQGFRTWNHAQPVAGNAAPSYPESLRRNNIEGSVLAQFVVDTAGRVDGGVGVTILGSTNELFSASVREALPTMRFASAQVDGRKVKQLVQMPFVFTLGERVSLGDAASDTTHRTVTCGQGACPVLRLGRVVSTARP